jgi:type IV pilus assembly protein PilO
MNDLIERLMELPPRQRMMLLVGAIGLIFFVYVYWVYWPQGERITQMETQLSSLQQERDRKAKLAANLHEARQLVADLQAALKEAVAQLPDTKEIPDLLSGISGVGRESGLEIVKFRQKEEQFQDFYAEVPVEMLVRGSYFQVEAFFGRVSQLQRIVNIRNISIKSPVVIPEEPIRLETSCSATTFRFLDEEEREKIRKQREAERKGKAPQGKGKQGGH